MWPSDSVARGFDPAVLDGLNIGESARLGRAVVPIHEDSGWSCVGFMSRSVKPFCRDCEKCHRPGDGCQRGERRWLFMTDFPKGEFLYNYAAARRPHARFVLLVEGVPDVLRATEAGVASVACFGTDLSTTQTGKLAALNRPVVIAFDDDTAGRESAARAATTNARPATPSWTK